MDKTKGFCAAYENNWEKCETCIYKEGYYKTHTYHKKLFTRSNIKLIAPSNSARDIICKVFNLDNIKVLVIPHQKSTLVQNDRTVNEKLRIAYVGYKGKYKGLGRI